MAQKVTVELVDDIDGSSAAETVQFGLDGTSYEIDLNTKNATKLRKTLDTYVQSSRRLAKSGKPYRRTQTAPSSKHIREWGRQNGWRVSDRGQIPADLRSAYEAAH